MNEISIEENFENTAEYQTADAIKPPAESTDQPTQEMPTNKVAVADAATATTATIKIEGQEIVLDVAIAEKDDLLKTALTPYYPSIKNANVTREIGADGQMIVSIVKRAEHKGKREK